MLWVRGGQHTTSSGCFARMASFAFGLLAGSSCFASEVNLSTAVIL